MDLVKYNTSEPSPHVKKIMTNFFMLQRYRDFQIQKPQVFQKEKQISKINFPKDAHQNRMQLPKEQNIKIESLINDKLKKQIIKKVKCDTINKKKQKKVDRLYNTYLTHYLNITCLESVMNGQPPLISVLQSKQEGDYLPIGQKKDHPHYSNVLKMIQIPNQNISSKYLPAIKKKNKNQHFTIEDNCVFKIRQLNLYLYYIFKYGNQQFEKIAQKIKTSVRIAKMLYDIFNDYLQLEDRIDRVEKARNSEAKKRQVDRVRKYVIKAIKKYKKKQVGVSSVYIPFQQQFISLRELRQYLTEKHQQNSEDDQQ